VALIARFVVDTSASARIGDQRVADELQPLNDAALVATCASLDAEALFSARSPSEYERLRRERAFTFEYLPTEDRHWQVALAAQRELARAGRHRSVGMSDLLTAVLAGEHRLTLIHYDADFEIAADVVDFEHRWIAPRGSL
jgi:hypothetical protein